MPVVVLELVLIRVAATSPRLFLDFVVFSPCARARSSTASAREPIWDYGASALKGSNTLELARSGPLLSQLHAQRMRSFEYARARSESLLSRRGFECAGEASSALAAKP